MMKHCIIVKWNEDVDKKAILEPVKVLFEGAREIDGVSDALFIENCVDIENRYDLMIQVIVEKEKLQNWNESEIHKTLKKEYGDMILSKAIFDYE
ncbi:MAG: hypothetical protein MJ115_02830 [Clostridia bacterium]|nr:hypothetical protein [Clostridia bacterium]